MTIDIDRDALLREAIRILLPYQYRLSAREVLGQAFELLGEDGFYLAGNVAQVEFMPEQYLRIWCSGENYVEWRFDTTMMAWSRPKGYTRLYGGHIGTFFFEQHIVMRS